MPPEPMPAEALGDEQPRESRGTSGGTTALRTAAGFVGSSLHRLKHTTGFAGGRPPVAGEDAQPRGLVLRRALVGRGEPLGRLLLARCRLRGPALVHAGLVGMTRLYSRCPGVAFK